MCVSGRRGQAGSPGRLRIEASHQEGQERLWRSLGAVGEGGAGQGQSMEAFCGRREEVPWEQEASEPQKGLPL